jgi:hypothetical protein
MRWLITDGTALLPANIPKLAAKKKIESGGLGIFDWRVDVAVSSTNISGYASPFPQNLKDVFEINGR